MIPAPSDVGAEEAVVNAVLWLKLAVEATGALVIGMGVVAAAVQFARSFASSPIRDYNRIRLTLARYLALALEFQLGADILSTAVAPSWDQIGKLGAIAVIRTALNYFLTREMREARESVDALVASREKVEGERA
jgi:uncharacterized membrane protein